MNRAEKNILSGVGWFIFGVVLTAMMPDSLFWGAMLAGVIQFILGLTQLGDEAKQAEFEKKIEKDVDNLVAEIKAEKAKQQDYWKHSGFTPKQSIFMRALMVAAYTGEDEKVLYPHFKATQVIAKQLFNYDLEDEQLMDSVLDYTQRRRNRNEMDDSYSQLFGLESEFDEIPEEEKLSFGTSLVKASHFVALGNPDENYKVYTYMEELRKYFGIDVASNLQLKKQAYVALKAQGLLSVDEEKNVSVSISNKEAAALLKHNQAVSDEIAVQVTTLDLESSDFYKTELLTAFKNLKFLYASGTSIKSVEGLASLHKLESLYLGKTKVSDLSPLTDLKNLTKVILSQTLVERIDPLRQMEKLEDLNLSKTPLKTIESLNNLTEMRDLNLSHTNITEVASLAKLTKMKYLDLAGTKITDVAPLSKLKVIKHLNLSNTKIENIFPLFNSEDLSKIDVSHTKIETLDPLSKLENLSHIIANGSEISGVLPTFAARFLMVVNLSDTKISDISSLATGPHLRRIYLNNTLVSDVSFLARKRRLRVLELDGSKVTDFSHFAKHPKLQHLKSVA